MKKVLAIASLLVAAFALNALAYDDLITNDNANYKQVGTMEFGAKLLFTSASNAFDSDSEKADDDWDDSLTQMRLPVSFKYGLMENLEVFGILPIFTKWDMGDAGESGIGDLWVGAKYGITPGGILTLRGALDLPLGDDEKGLGNAGGLGIDVAAMSAMQMDAIGLNGQVGFRWNGEDGDTKWAPGIGFYLDGEGSYNFSETLAGIAGLECMFIGEGKFDGNDASDSNVNWVDLNLGACLKLAPNMGLRGDLIYTLTGTNTDASMGVLIGFNYGF
jgi:hypothetical protein